MSFVDDIALSFALSFLMRMRSAMFSQNEIPTTFSIIFLLKASRGSIMPSFEHAIETNSSAVTNSFAAFPWTAIE